MPKIDYSSLPKMEFGIFQNEYKKTERQPTKTGKIEITESLLKGMLERAKSGEMPVLSVAVWPRTSKNGTEYENMQIQLRPPNRDNGTSSKPEPEPEPEPEEQINGFNWD